MSTVRQYIWQLRKKMIQQARIIAGARRVTGMVALSGENAEAAYGVRKDVTIHTFFCESKRALIPPKCLHEDKSRLAPRSLFPEKCPDYDAVLLDIQNSDFTFQHHHLIDDKRRVIYEPQMQLDQLPIKDKFLGECKKLDGTVAYLANTIFCQYSHWLQRQLSMLLAYWEVFGKESVDYYYVGDGRVKDFARESLLYLGIRPEQIVSFPCRGDRALACIKSDPRPPSQPSLRMDDATHQFLKEKLFKPNAPIAGKRLFIMRGDVSGRRELNLPAVREVMEPLGFEFVGTQGMTMQAEADLFGNADVIIAVHGAALHNLLFSRPGTKVIEIFPPDYFEESNYVIANHSGCDYFYTIGAPIAGENCGASLWDRNRTDVMIDVGKLVRLCREAGVLS